MADPNADKKPTRPVEKRPSPTRKIRLPVTVTLNGVDYPPGAEVTLDAAEAADLSRRFGEVAVGVGAHASADDDGDDA